MKAIILAAGLGSRLQPLTENQPKCLVPLRDKPILEYQLAVFNSCGIDDISIVSGYKQEALAKYKLTEYINSEYSDTNMLYSLFCAEAAFDDDLIISYGDIVYEKRILEKLIESQDQFSVVVDLGWLDLWKLRMDDPLSDAETMILNNQEHIVSLGKKTTDLSEIQGQYTGLFKISKDSLTAIKNYYHQLDAAKLNTRKMYMTDFIQLVIDNLFPIKAVLVNHGWLEIDTFKDWQLYEDRSSFPQELFDFSEPKS